MTGALLYVTGLTATSFVHNIEIMFITYGILTGLGSCFCRTSCFLIVAKYFNKKRSLATGSVTMGSSVGMFIWGPTTQVLLDSFGWRNTFRVIAVSCTLIFLFGLTFNPNVEEKDTIPEEAACEQSTEKSGDDDNNALNDNCSDNFEPKKEKLKILDFSVWRIPQYCILVTSFTIMFLCRFIPTIHLVSDNSRI